LAGCPGRFPQLVNPGPPARESSTEANLHGIRITVYGKVKGDIVASERLELTPPL